MNVQEHQMLIARAMDTLARLSDLTTPQKATVLNIAASLVNYDVSVTRQTPDFLKVSDEVMNMAGELFGKAGTAAKSAVKTVTESVLSKEELKAMMAEDDEDDRTDATP